ncbi:MAG TPA: glycosyl hydrolase 53 family protein [Tepidisphaeraceae bacterium]|nr:glycosyl hydrolase 53 family protein [Tepidisphaeraceae bacterium]
MLRAFAVGLVLASVAAAPAADRQFLAGVDISMLPTIEQAGGIFRDGGKPGDAIAILRDHGCNLFRVRLFVDPDSDYATTFGAVQNLDYVRGLARRIKAAGGLFLLDLHYSDTWADPGKQYKPKAWEKLGFDDLVRQVHDYTASVMSDLAAAGAMPDMVQVGNEITSGMIWPDGKLLDVPADQEAAQWRKYAELFNAGAAAVHSFSTPTHPIKVMLHIHGGGRAGLPQWFFGKLSQNVVNYDCIGLSFYPAWDDSIDALKTNMADLIHTYGKDVFVAETSYPWRGGGGIEKNPTMKWPLTPAGQKDFLRDLIALIKAAPDGHGIGFSWWYPEAIPVPHLGVWRDGAEALFDDHGNALPAMDLFNAGEP